MFTCWMHVGAKYVHLLDVRWCILPYYPGNRDEEIDDAASETDQAAPHFEMWDTLQEYPDDLQVAHPSFSVFTLSI